MCSEIQKIPSYENGLIDSDFAVRTENGQEGILLL